MSLTFPLHIPAHESVLLLSPSRVYNVRCLPSGNDERKRVGTRKEGMRIERIDKLVSLFVFKSENHLCLFSVYLGFVYLLTPSFSIPMHVTHTYPNQTLIPPPLGFRTFHSLNSSLPFFFDFCLLVMQLTRIPPTPSALRHGRFFVSLCLNSLLARYKHSNRMVSQGKPAFAFALSLVPCL